jgi:hypothetical protein
LLFYQCSHLQWQLYRPYKFSHVHVRDAMALYKVKDKDNNSFQLIHCLSELKNESKWHSKQKNFVDQKYGANKKQKFSKNGTLGNSRPNIVDSKLDIQSPMAWRGQWVVTNKKAKEALRPGEGDDIVSRNQFKCERKRRLWHRERKKVGEEVHSL